MWSAGGNWTLIESLTGNVNRVNGITFTASLAVIDQLSVMKHTNKKTACETMSSVVNVAKGSFLVLREHSLLCLIRNTAKSDGNTKKKPSLDALVPTLLLIHHVFKSYQMQNSVVAVHVKEQSTLNIICHTDDLVR